MVVRFVVWTDGDRDERRDGEIYGVREQSHPYTPSETGDNHRRVQVPGGVGVADLAYLEDQWIVSDVQQGRRRYRLSAAQTTTVKAAVAASTTVINRTDLENNLRDDVV